DGTVREYSVAFTAGQPVVAVRIDPSQAAGTIRIRRVRLTTGDGTLLHEWALRTVSGTDANSGARKNVMFALAADRGSHSSLPNTRRLMTPLTVDSF
ncbi:MAG: hypothetical protein KDA81_22415, partial [Planctomycetaceae bacterium]|nr:hypothetical protein [Planctomycetaceae bacterium]